MMSQLGQGKITVSIIEDSDIHRALFFEKLSENERFSVVSQDKYGRSGIESVKKHQSKLVLLDFQLPDITGIEVSKRIKSHLSNTKILAITAHTEKSIKGNPIDNVSTKAWWKALSRAGIEKFRWHDLRYTWASWHVQNGTSLQELQHLGGWSSFSIVLRYAHLSSSHLRNAVSKLPVTNWLHSEKSANNIVRDSVVAY